MTLRKALLAATVLALPAAAQAQPVSGLYVGAGAGLNFHQESSDSGVKVEYKHPGAVGWAPSAGASATACAPRSKATTATTRLTPFA
jgi:hypothetical protein